MPRARSSPPGHRLVTLACRASMGVVVVSALIGLCMTAAGRPAGAAPALSSPSVKQSSGSTVVGKAKDLHITASGYPKPMITESGALPTGLSFQSGMGSATISGTPAAGTGNDYTIMVTATNSQGVDTEPYDLTVYQYPLFPPNFCPAPMTVGRYTHDDEQTTAYPAFFGLSENSSLPSGVTFSQPDPVGAPNSGVLSGTPAPGSGGTYGLQYSSDANNTTRTLHCKLVTDEAPAFTDSGMAVTKAGVAPSSPVNITGTPGYPKTLTLTTTGAIPVGMKSHTMHTRDGFVVSLAGTPGPSSPGVYPIDASASNGATTSEDFVLVVQSAQTTPQSTSLSLAGGTDPVTYGSSMLTYTATVSGGTAPSGYVQFSYGDGITTVPVVGGQASFTTPATLDVGDYTLTATYTGDAVNASSTTSTDLTVGPAPTTLDLTSSATSTTFGVPVTYTATVACSTSCDGLTPSGNVDFTESGNDTTVELVNGVATFTTDPTIGPGLANEVDVVYSPYSDAAQDFATTSPAVQVFYDIGAVELSLQMGDGVQADGTTAVSPGSTVTVDPTATNELSAQLGAVVTGNGTPPGPLSVEIAEGTTDETAAAGISSPSEAAPSADSGTGLTDYFWTIPAGGLNGISGTSATVTVSSPGSDDFAPASVTFTLDW